MQRRPIILFVVSLVIAAFVAMGVRSRLQTTPPPQEVKTATRVLVAASPIPAGSFIRPEIHLRWMETPPEKILPGQLKEGERTAEEFTGAVARRAIGAGEPVTDSLLVKKSEGGFMAAVLLPGMRAVSVAVTATSGNAGFIFPGDRVDVIVTHTIKATQGSADAPTTGQDLVVSETFLENVRVVAIDQMIDNPDNKAVVAKTVTLEVSPKQAQMVSVADEMGKLSLSLRSLNTTEEKTHPTNAGNPPIAADIDPFFGTDNTPPSPSTPDNTTSSIDISRTLGGNGGHSATVNVIHGDKSEKIQFTGGGEE